MKNMSVEKQYTDIYTQYEDVIRQHAPEAMNDLRTQAFEDFKRLGFPSLKDENFRYTDVLQAFAHDYGLNLNRIKPQVNPADVFRCDVPNMRSHLYYVVNDSFYGESQTNPLLPQLVYAGKMKPFFDEYPLVASWYYGKIANTSDDAITAFNTMFAQDGFVIYVPHNTMVERPIQLVNIINSQTDIMANRRVLVIMKPGSSAQLLVCDHSIDEVKSLSTQVIEIFAEFNSTIDYYDIEESTTNTTRFSSLHVKQDFGSNVLVNGITLNNGLTRNDYRINMVGEDAETTLCGMAIQDKHQQVDTYSQITHAREKCKSTELFKNVLDDNSVCSFSGRILVKEGADKTEAYQTNRNMCITSDARVYSKPQLEIYADDVKCSHGMTTGQIDEQALFYMQSRGISREEARTLLSVAFTSDVIENVRLAPLRDRLQYLVEKRFRGESARCDSCNMCK